MGRTACTEPQCLYKGTLYLFTYTEHTTIYIYIYIHLFIYLYIYKGKLEPKEGFKET